MSNDNPLEQALTGAFYKLGNALSDELSDSSSPSEEKLNQIIGLLQSNTNQATTRSAITPTQTTINTINSINQRKPRLGMNCKTGGLISGIEHLKQSINDIIKTRISSRVMRRHYGSNVFDSVDLPQNQLTQMNLFAGIATAIDQFEPRFTLQRVQLNASQQQQDKGLLFFALQGIYKKEKIEIGVI